MRRLPRATWIAIVVIGLLTMLASVMVSIGAPALTWLSPWVALVLFVLISLALIGVSLWQERQKAASEPSEADARENRQIMLDRVQNTWITGFLENPLYYSYDEQLLLLPLRERVGSHFDLVLSNPLEPTQPIPSGTTLAQVFDQAGGELLILGEPGAGKTTLLLELTRDLLKRAKDNEAAPMPVVLILSSWATRKLPLEQWIIEELKAKYDVPSQIGKAWVKANQLLLLLDGLDEVAPSALPACIDAINAYYHQAHRSLVMCSRTKEFLDQPGRLALHTAVIVQPLSSEQVDSYLDGLAARGEDVVGLKHVLHQSAALRALATTPFFLTVLLLAYHGKPVQELLALVKAAPTDQQHLTFHDYVERMLRREGARIHAPAQQTKHWLAWLASQMEEEDESELYLEEFPPDWLPKRQKAFFEWSMWLGGGLGGGLIFGLLIGLRYGLIAGLGGGLVFELFAGLFGWLVFMLASHRREWHLEQFPPDWLPKRQKAFFEEWRWLGGGLGGELVLGLLIGLRYGLVFGLVSGLVFGLVFGMAIELVFGMVLGLVFGLLRRRGRRLGGGLLFGLRYGALGGLVFWLLRWLFGGLVGGLVFGLVSGLLIGLVGGLVFGVLGKPVFGFLGRQLTKRSTLSPNEGIRRSLKNGLVFGLVGGLVFGLVGGLVFGLVGGLVFGLVFGLQVGLQVGLAVAVQHYLLRFWLWQARCTPAPWRYVAFLDDAVEQLLLRKVGGGYIFRHRLLQDYFASLDVVPPHDPSFRAEAHSVLQNASNGDPSV